MGRDSERSRLPTSGDLCCLRAPKEFVVEGQVRLWSLSERRQHAVAMSTPALVIAVERSRIPKEPDGERIMMAQVQIDGMPFRIRADWLIPLDTHPQQRHI